jgi:hypothetical protein
MELRVYEHEAASTCVSGKDVPGVLLSTNLPNCPSSERELIIDCVQNPDSLNPDTDPDFFMYQDPFP